jgi:hypothetical protein
MIVNLFRNDADKDRGPGHRMAAGIVAGTKVATAMGWRAVDALTEGDLVLTFDHGLQPLKSATRTRQTCQWAAPQDWPLLVPAGALGNTEDGVVLPGQAVMIESDLAEGMTGDPFVLVPAGVLDGVCGIEAVLPDGGFEVVVLTFARDEVVFTKPGLLCHCPTDGTRSHYDVLSGPAAGDLVAALDRQMAA